MGQHEPVSVGPSPRSPLVCILQTAHVRTAHSKSLGKKKSQGRKKAPQGGQGSPVSPNVIQSRGMLPPLLLSGSQCPAIGHSYWLSTTGQSAPWGGRDVLRQWRGSSACPQGAVPPHGWKACPICVQPKHAHHLYPRYPASQPAHHHCYAFTRSPVMDHTQGRGAQGQKLPTNFWWATMPNDPLAHSFIWECIYTRLPLTIPGPFFLCLCHPARHFM